MAFNIVTPIAIGDGYEATKAKLVTVAETWLGSGQASGGNTPATWADIRTKLNLILTAFGKTTIGASDSGATARTKINGIIDAEALLSGTALAWWNADRSDLISLSGSQVTSWTDSIGGYSVTQSTSALRPIYSATSFNGSPGLTWDGSDDYLELASQPFPSGSNGSEFWGVVSQDSLLADSTTRYLFSYGGDANTTRRTIGRVASASNGLRAQAGDGATVPSTGPAADFSGRVVARASFTSTTIGASLDGGALTTTAAVPATGTARVRIGAVSNSALNNYWNGKVRDMIVTGPLSGNAPTYLANFLLPRRAP